MEACQEFCEPKSQVKEVETDRRENLLTRGSDETMLTLEDMQLGVARYFTRPAPRSYPKDATNLDEGQIVLIYYTGCFVGEQNETCDNWCWRLAVVCFDYDIEEMFFTLITKDSHELHNWLRVERHDASSGSTLYWLDYASSPDEFGGNLIQEMYGSDLKDLRILLDNETDATYKIVVGKEGISTSSESEYNDEYVLQSDSCIYKEMY